jgi:phage tail sheath protein FI
MEEVPSVRVITGVQTSVTAFIGTIAGGPLNQPVHLLTFAEFELNFGGLTPDGELGYSVRQFFLNGGIEAWVVRVADNATEEHWREGIRVLDSVDLLNLLVLPAVTMRSVVIAATEYCEKRRAFFIIDSPRETETPDDIRQRVESGELTRSRNAAVYYPWVRITDPLNNASPRLSPPGGTVAGLFARTDATGGVWKAPAGIEAALNGVTALEYQLTDTENELLNPRGINCLRRFSLSGIVAWGARTLAGDDRLASEFKYIPVRRTAMYIEESAIRSIKWAMLESNAEPLWAQLRLNIGAFMHDLFRQGAFQGQVPSEAYFVRCDAETTSQTDIDAGVVNVVIGFAPLKPTEFVVIKIQQITQPGAAASAERTKNFRHGTSRRV